jgi:predicted esterase
MTPLKGFSTVSIYTMKNNLILRIIFFIIAIAITQGILFIPAETPSTQNTLSLTKQEQSTFKNIATEWIKLGEWCISKKLGTQARLYADKAEAADATNPKLKSLKEQATACEDSATDEDNKARETKVTSTNRTVAGYYDSLSNSVAQESDPKVKERSDKYLLAAIELVPSESRWTAVASVVNNLVKAKKFDRAGNIADRALALKPPEKLLPAFKNALDNAAANNVILKPTSTHPIKYYFSLPKDFKRVKDKKWPVLICVDGAGSNFNGIATSYANRRGKLSYIVVAPCTFSNTNAIQGDMLTKYRQFYSDEVIEEGNKQPFDWDEQGVLAIINDLQTNYDAESRVYITGFSGGGNVTYMMIFKHPDLLNGAAPACANFVSRGYSGLNDQFSQDILNFPIHLITGEKDPHREFTYGKKDSPGIDPQTDQAEALLKELGYPDYKRTMIPGMGHSAAEDHVINTLKPYLEGKKKRSDKLD